MTVYPPSREHNFKAPRDMTVEELFDMSNRVCIRCGVKLTAENETQPCSGGKDKSN